MLVIPLGRSLWWREGMVVWMRRFRGICCGLGSGKDLGLCFGDCSGFLGSSLRFGCLDGFVQWASRETVQKHGRKAVGPCSRSPTEWQLPQQQARRPARNWKTPTHKNKSFQPPGQRPRLACCFLPPHKAVGGCSLQAQQARMPPHDDYLQHHPVVSGHCNQLAWKTTLTPAALPSAVQHADS